MSDVDSGVEPYLALLFELDLFLVDGDTIRVGGEVLLAVLAKDWYQWWMVAQARLTPNRSQRSRHSANDAAAACSFDPRPKTVHQGSLLPPPGVL